MAVEILRAYGFESGTLMPDSVDRGTGARNVRVLNVGHTGSYSIGGSTSVIGDTGWWRVAIPGSVSDPAISCWPNLYRSFNTSGTGTSYHNIRFLLSTGQYIDLRWNGTSHTYDAYVNNVLVASGTIEVSVNTWFNVQCYLVVADAGSIQVKIDGHMSIDYSGDTQPGGAATVTYVYFYTNGAGSDGLYDSIDDLVIASGGFTGGLVCPELTPTGDTAQADFTPSTGADHYALVDERPANDDDYNSTSTTGHADELALSDYDGATYIPRAVTIWVRALMGSPDGDSLKVGLNSNGTVDDTVSALSTQAEYYYHTADNNPDDAAEWDDADIDALLLRYESVIP